MKKGEIAGVVGRGVGGWLGMESLAKKPESYTAAEAKDQHPISNIDRTAVSGACLDSSTQQVDETRAFCAGEKLVLLPSADGVPFELVIGGLNHEKCTYLHGDQTACSREFATYNLMTITALFDRSHRRVAQETEGKIVFQPYPSGGRIFEASGNVVDKDEHGGHRRNRQDSLSAMDRQSRFIRLLPFTGE
jgi:hypothetical protein